MYLTESLESMARILRQSRIVVAGGINMDIQGTSSASFLAGDSNPGQVKTFPGGVGRNIAENLVRLGCSVELVAAVGDDEDSRALISGTEALGIGVSGMLMAEGASCPRYLCLLDSHGALVGAVADMQAVEALGVDELAARQELFDRSDAIVVDANLPASSIAWIAREYGRRNSGKRPLLVLDPVSAAKASRASPWIGAFDLVKPNRAEARVLASAAVPDRMPPMDESLRDAMSLLASGTGAVHVSLGAEGLVSLVRDDFMHPPGTAAGAISITGFRLLPPGSGAFPPGTSSGIQSVSGAGDAGCAALVAATLAGLDPAASGSLALAASSLCAASMHTVHPELSLDLVLTISQGVVHEPIPRSFI